MLRLCPPMLQDHLQSLICHKPWILSDSLTLTPLLARWTSWLQVGRFLTSLCSRGPARKVLLSWQIFFFGDVEINPGPIKYPYTVCSKPVKRNQQGLSCDTCVKLSHANCCGIDKDQYQVLNAAGDFQWTCPTCVLGELPFADSSSLSLDNNEVALLDISSFYNDNSLLNEYNNKAIFCLLNPQSMMNKLDELRYTLSCTKRPVLFGISESWLDSSISDG